MFFLLGPPRKGYNGPLAQPAYAQGFVGQTMVREYPSPESFNRDAARMAGDGWQVVSTIERRQRAGCMRLLLLWWLVLLRPPKPTIVVTYQRVR